MTFDFKKECKEFYMPQRIPGIIEIPPPNRRASSIRSVGLHEVWLKNLTYLQAAYTATVASTAAVTVYGI